MALFDAPRFPYRILWSVDGFSPLSFASLFMPLILYGLVCMVLYTIHILKIMSIENSIKYWTAAKIIVSERK